MAGQKPLDIARSNPLERFDEVSNAAAMVGIDSANTAVAKQIVARKQQLPESKRKLATRMPRRVPDLKLQVSDLNLVAVLHEPFDLHGWHFEVNILGRNFGIR